MWFLTLSIKYINIIANVFSEVVSKKKKSLFTQENIQQAQPHHLQTREYLIFSEDFESTPVTADGCGPTDNPISMWGLFSSQEWPPESPYLPLLTATTHFMSTWGSSLSILFKDYKTNVSSGLVFLLPQGMCKQFFIFFHFTRKTLLRHFSKSLSLLFRLS